MALAELRGEPDTVYSGALPPVVGSSLTIVNPYISQRIVDTFIAGDNALQNLTQERQLLIMLCLGMIGFSLLRTGLAYFTTMQYEKSSQNMMYNIRIFCTTRFKDRTETITTITEPAIS